MGSAVLDQFLFARLTWNDIPSTVLGSLPILFFGDPWSAQVATIGINPSWQEYLSPDHDELDGADRRFETLQSLRAATRRSLNETQKRRAIDRMRRYFDPNRPVYSWFSELSQVIEGMGASFRLRSAVHLDLVQESTDPAWSELRKLDCPQAAAVLRRDLPFLKHQVDRFPFSTLVCTSALVLANVREFLHVRVKAQGRVALLDWTIGTAEIPGRPSIGIVGWNIPLKRATGLKRGQHQQFGSMLASEMKKAGIGLRCNCKGARVSG